MKTRLVYMVEKTKGLLGEVYSLPFLNKKEWFSALHIYRMEETIIGQLYAVIEILYYLNTGKKLKKTDWYSGYDRVKQYYPNTVIKIKEIHLKNGEKITTKNQLLISKYYILLKYPQILKMKNY